jgi:hypothetical protein
MDQQAAVAVDYNDLTVAEERDPQPDGRGHAHATQHIEVRLPVVQGVELLRRDTEIAYDGLALEAFLYRIDDIEPRHHGLESFVRFSDRARAAWAGLIGLFELERRGLPYRRIQEKGVHPVLAVNLREFRFDVRDARGIVHTVVGYPHGLKQRGQCLPQGLLRLDGLVGQPPVADKDRKRQLVKPDERKQGVDHVSHTRALHQHGRMPAGQGGTGADAHALLFPGEPHVLEGRAVRQGDHALHAVAGQRAQQVHPASGEGI